MRIKSALFLVIVVMGISNGLWPARHEKSTEYFPVYGFTVWRPPGWRIFHYERAGTVWLKPDAADILMNGTVEVVFWAGACSREPRTGAFFETEIDSLKTLYALEAIDVVGEVQSVRIGDQTFSWIVIELPPSKPESESDLSQQRQLRILTKGTMRRVAIYQVEDSEGRWLPGYIYFGGSDKLNEQALEIMHSVKLVCR